MTFAILFDPRHSGQSAAGVTWAGIVVQLDGRPFPTDAWTDFAAVVLTSWSTALVAMLSGGSTSEEVMFMEGPYSVVIERSASESQWEVQCIERGRSRVIRDRAVVERDAVIMTVRACGRAAISAFRGRGWTTADIAALEKELDALDRSLPS